MRGSIRNLCLVVVSDGPSDWRSCCQYTLLGDGLFGGLLVLDDPVQHIDDFRSLQFVEVLSAMRLDGRQIVCTVEDEALADLLCRRLSNRPDEGGRRYEVGVDTDGGTKVVRNEQLAPLAVRALRHSA